MEMEFGSLAFYVRWLHVLSGVMWIGLLWYFNFVQVPAMPGIPDEQKPAVGKHIAPKALFWFRWGAMGTIVFGLILAHLDATPYSVGDVLTLGAGQGVIEYTLLGFGMWFGIIMWFNVWFVIWPNQKVALGLIDSDKDKAKSAATAKMFSRINTLLSIPMFYGMVSFQNFQS